jgi:hypothetical protein
MTDPLATTDLPDGVVTLVAAVPDEHALALLLELDAEGPIAVRTLLAQTDLCESDLHGRLAELQAGGLIEERQIVGERGYATTDTASDALAQLK